MQKMMTWGMMCFIALTGVQCNKDNCEAYPGGKQYTAWAPVNYYPLQERFKIGDTISIEIIVPPVLVDTSSGVRIDASKIKFNDAWGEDIGGVMVRFIKDMNGKTQWVFAAQEFTFIEHVGRVRFAGPGNGSLSIKFGAKSDGMRTAKFQIIPNVHGVYTIIFGTARINITGIADNYCGSSLQVLFGAEVAHNFHLLDDHDKDKVGTYEQNRGSFTFLVEE